MLLNLARDHPEALAALVALVRPGGVVVNTVRMPLPPTTSAACAASTSSSAATPTSCRGLSTLVDRGKLHVDVAERVPLAELAAIHARAAAGTLSGKIIVLPPA